MQKTEKAVFVSVVVMFAVILSFLFWAGFTEAAHIDAPVNTPTGQAISAPIETVTPAE